MAVKVRGALGKKSNPLRGLVKRQTGPDGRFKLYGFFGSLPAHRCNAHRDLSQYARWPGHHWPSSVPVTVNVNMKGVFLTDNSFILYQDMEMKQLNVLVVEYTAVSST